MVTRLVGGVLQRVAPGWRVHSVATVVTSANTARDNCFDRCHASGMFVWAEGKFWWAPLGASYRGREDPRCGNAFGLGYGASNEVPAPLGCLINTLVEQRKSKPSDLRYPSCRPPAPWALPCPSCPLSCLVLRWLQLPPCIDSLSAWPNHYCTRALL